MVREIRKSLKVREKSGNFKIVFVQTPQKLNKHIIIRLDDCVSVFR